MREYVLKVAADKKWQLRHVLRDKLQEELRSCAPTEEDLEYLASDLDNVCYIWGSTFAKIDEIIAEYLMAVATKGDLRDLALDAVKRILAL